MRRNFCLRCSAVVLAVMVSIVPALLSAADHGIRPTHAYVIAAPFSPDQLVVAQDAQPTTDRITQQQLADDPANTERANAQDYNWPFNDYQFTDIEDELSPHSELGPRTLQDMSPQARDIYRKKLVATSKRVMPPVPPQARQFMYR